MELINFISCSNIFRQHGRTDIPETQLEQGNEIFQLFGLRVTAIDAQSGRKCLAGATKLATEGGRPHSLRPNIFLDDDSTLTEWHVATWRRRDKYCSWHPDCQCRGERRCDCCTGGQTRWGGSLPWTPPTYPLWTRCPLSSWCTCHLRCGVMAADR